jgi:hypothetical protein
MLNRLPIDSTLLLEVSLTGSSAEICPYRVSSEGMPENLTSEDADSLISLCAFETVAKEEYSPFCDLFDDDDFEGFEYAVDLDKFYFTGYVFKIRSKLLVKHLT